MAGGQFISTGPGGGNIPTTGTDPADKLRNVVLAGIQTAITNTTPERVASNLVSGTGSATGTAGVVCIAAQGAGLTVNITDIIMVNSGGTPSLLTIQSDPTGTPTNLLPLYNAASSTLQVHLVTPIRVPANKAVGFACGTSVTTQFCTLVSYVGS